MNTFDNEKGWNIVELGAKIRGAWAVSLPKPKGGEIFLFYTDDPKKQGNVNICTKLIL